MIHFFESIFFAYFIAFCAVVAHPKGKSTYPTYAAPKATKVKAASDYGYPIYSPPPAPINKCQKIKVETFGPKLNTTFKSVKKNSNKNTAKKNGTQGALDFIKGTLKLSETQYRITDSYKSQLDCVTHLYVRQLHKGLEVENGNINVNVDENGNILSYGSSFSSCNMAPGFEEWNAPKSAQKVVSASKAFETLAKHLKMDAGLKITETAAESTGSKSFVLSGIPCAEGEAKAYQTYMACEGKLVPTWRINFRLNHNWFNAAVAADGSKVIELVDWVSSASYRVVDVGDSDPGNRKLVSNPEDSKASSRGWHDDLSKKYTNTQGNNVDVSGPKGGSDYRPDGSADLKFDFTFDEKRSPSANLDAAITNVFFWVNRLHDIFYKAGFDEAAGNFQRKTIASSGSQSSGKDSDPIIVRIQDTGGAGEFAAPPDGQSGTMKLRINNGKDEAFDPDIITHEFVHGMVSRLSGGPSNPNCAGYGQAQGMAEGLADFFAIILRIRQGDSRTKEMAFAPYSGGGLRKYSTDKGKNPAKYSDVNGAKDPHKIGQVFASILYDLFWNVMDTKKQLTGDWNSASLTAANTYIIRLIISAWQRSSCISSFVQAREKLLEADRDIRIGRGAQQCAIYKAFAGRGVGQGADAGTPVKEDTGIVSGVC